MNTLVQHLKKFKLIYGALAISVIVGLGAYSANRVPILDEAEIQLAGQAGTEIVQFTLPLNGQKIVAGSRVNAIWQSRTACTRFAPCTLFLAQKSGRYYKKVDAFNNIITNRHQFLLPEDARGELSLILSRRGGAYGRRNFVAVMPSTSLKPAPSAPEDPITLPACTTADWACSAFLPTDCPESGQRVRLCTLKNQNCENPEAVRPATAESCEYTAPEPACGNGQVETGEQCDDGNSNSGDGCSTTCQQEVSADAGTLNADSISGSISDDLVTGGSDDVLVAKYNFTAHQEAFEVQKLQVINDLSGAFDSPADTALLEQVKIRYPDANGNTVTKTGALAFGSRTFSNLDFRVPKDSSATLEILADVRGITTSTFILSGQQFRLGLRDTGNSAATFTAVGQDSATALYEQAVSNNGNVPTHVVRKAKPVFTGVNQATTVMGTTNVELYKFQVTAEGGNVVLGRLVFDVNTSGLQTNGTDDVYNFNFERNGFEANGVNIYALGSSGCGASATVNVEDAASGSGLQDACTNVAGVDNALYKVIVSFDSPEEVSAGATSTYTLKANITGAGFDDSINTKLAAADTSLIAGELLQDGFADVVGSNHNVIWSDKSGGLNGQSRVFTYPTVNNGNVEGGGTDDFTNSYLLNTGDLEVFEYNKAGDPDPVCGNGQVEGNEQCDDGNTQTETCAYGQQNCLVCGATCNEVAGVATYCGDGIIQAAAGEQCDDGNSNSGDGCSATCQQEVSVGTAVFSQSQQATTQLGTTNVELYKFLVAANSGQVELSELEFDVSTTGFSSSGNEDIYNWQLDVNGSFQSSVDISAVATSGCAAPSAVTGLRSSSYGNGLQNACTDAAGVDNSTYRVTVSLSSPIVIPSGNTSAIVLKASIGGATTDDALTANIVSADGEAVNLSAYNYLK